MKWLTVFPMMAAAWCASPNAHAGDGDLDAVFGMGGRQTVAFDLGGERVDRAYGLALAPNGAIHLAGYVHDGAHSASIGLARLMPDGTPDNGYGHPVHPVPGFDWVYVTDAALQLDGKLVVAGYAQRPAGRDIVVCRFMINGDIDAVFGDAQTPGCGVIDISANDYAYALVIQGDGRIVIAGKILSDRNRAIVARLDMHGKPDPSFGPGGVRVLLPDIAVDTSLRDLALAPGGDLVALGHVVIGTGDSDWLVFRLKAKDGTFDPAFDNSGIKQIHFDLGSAGYRGDYGRAVSVLPNGSILLAGHAQKAAGVYCMAAVRLASNGAFGNFGQNGLYVDPLCESGLEINDIAIQSDGRLVLAGASASDDMLAFRLTGTGVRDASFGNGGVARIAFDLAGGASVDTATRIVARGDRILVAGYAERASDGYDYAVARLKSSQMQRER